EGYALTGRHSDVITTGHQFREMFPGHALTLEVRRYMATTYERTGRPLQAARELDANWRQGEVIPEGVRALKLFQAAKNADGFREAAALARSMADKLPVDTILTGCGLIGLEMANQAELWAEGLALAKVLLRRNAPLLGQEKHELWSYTANFETRLGQHVNAVASHRKAHGNITHQPHNTLIDALIRAKSPPAEVEREARNYMAAYPTANDRYQQLAKAASAHAGAGDLTRALKLGAELMAIPGMSAEMAQTVVTWCGETHARSEQSLLRAIRANPKHAGPIRAVLALNLYDKRMEAGGKARAMARNYFANTPTGDSLAEYTIAYLLRTAPDEATFLADIKLILTCARKHLHLRGFQERIANVSLKDAKRNRSWQGARKTFSNETNTRLWVQVGESGGKSGQACKQLLQQKQPPELRRLLLTTLAYNYLHHFGGTSQKKAAEHYRQLCSEFPRDYAGAQKWLEAATYSDQAKEMQAAAARHVLTFPPQATTPNTWQRLIDTRDPMIIRKALPWIAKASPLS
ncbi:MAG: hypothetical protein VYC95_03705, partial [Verrucomicrobiota bacterium]|nr:hypothetical protein [Verrucomicrobiota bacterium]